MFVINLTYIKPLEEIEKHIDAHREFLDAQYANGVFLASGPKVPRTGGVILASGRVSREELDMLLRNDPFMQLQIAHYEVTEFQPAKHADALNGLI